MRIMAGELCHTAHFNGINQLLERFIGICLSLACIEGLLGKVK